MAGSCWSICSCGMFNGRPDQMRLFSLNFFFLFCFAFVEGGFERLRGSLPSPVFKVALFVDVRVVFPFLSAAVSSLCRVR